MSIGRLLGSDPTTKPPYLDTIQDRITTERGNRNVAVLSDFDNTLSMGGGVTPKVAEAAKDLHLVVATARLATSTRLPSFWEKGLVRPDVPIVVENGGSLAFKDKDGVRFVDVVEPHVPDKLAGVFEKLQGNRKELGVEAHTTIKLGRTLIDLVGISDPYGLASRMDALIDDPSVRTVFTGSTLTVQDQSVSKPGGFLKYLDTAGLDRSNLYVVGMGDAPNDRETFDHADLSLAFHEDVAPLADIHVTEGAFDAPDVLRAIHRAAK